MNGTQISSSVGLGNAPNVWSAVGIGDFNGDGKSDVLWRHSNGTTAIWLMNGASALGQGLGIVASTWSIAEIGDYDGDGKSDVLWRDTLGDLVIWFMSGATIASTASILGNVSTSWTVQSLNIE